MLDLRYAMFDVSVLPLLMLLPVLWFLMVTFCRVLRQASQCRTVTSAETHARQPHPLRINQAARSSAKCERASPIGTVFPSCIYCI